LYSSDIYVYAAGIANEKWVAEWSRADILFNLHYIHMHYTPRALSMSTYDF